MQKNYLMARKIRDHQSNNKQIAIVVLEGEKIVLSDNIGLAPLCKASRDVVNPDDEIIVLTLLRVKNSSTSEVGSSCSGHCNQSCDQTDPYIRFLREQITQRKDLYLRIFKPFYHACKTNGVKFQVKVAAGFRPKDIIVEEANSVRANWILMDSCFSKHLTFRLSGTDCNISLVSDVEENSGHIWLTTSEVAESSSSIYVACNLKRSKLKKGSTSVELASTITDCYPQPQVVVNNNETPPCPSSIPASKITETEIPIPSAPIELQQKKPDVSKKPRILSGQPLQLTWEAVMDITHKFKSRTWINGHDRNCMNYYGYFEENQSFVLVKRYNKHYSSILEAEKKAALFLQHKNILNLIGYYRDEHDILLVFPLVMEGTLEKHLTSELGKRRWKLTFQDKLKIAIGIAQGIRYMHEDCPRGPIVHGQLQPANIFLTSDMQPVISGFETATWLQLKQEFPILKTRYQVEDCLEHGSILQIKSDIFCFGVLLLRLFCRRSAPKDDKILIEWARPLLLDRAFHLLLEEDSDDVDMLAIYRVFSAARMCTAKKPTSRPYISQVISILKGENFCIIQSSSSDTSTSF